MSKDICEREYRAALDARAQQSHYSSYGDCAAQWGDQCRPYVTSSGDHWFIPALAGFAIGRMLGHRDYYYPAPYYGGGWGGPYRYRPDRGGGWDSRSVWRRRAARPQRRRSHGAGSATAARHARVGVAERGAARRTARDPTMERIIAGERADWRELAGKMGFHFHTLDGVPYWDESAHYRLTLREVEQDLENPTEELHEMCMDLVSRAVARRAVPAQARHSAGRSGTSCAPPGCEATRTCTAAWIWRTTAAAPRSCTSSTTTRRLHCTSARCSSGCGSSKASSVGTLPRGADQFNSVQQKLQQRVRAHRLTAGCRDSLRFDP